ncbi:hypothetical protein C5F50_05965 [Nitrosopumilus ureiphilus]|uniref:Uncharacterized protein n=2 Tax=Nitrosopumilus ureiphilus TaxID=1470067 RepID=A0A7D5M5N7_9ARCH|nr:hypothetical protein C5F50_05965 [Nitrosopumilus ureiphilus]
MYKILDILAREIGNPMSINEIKNKIECIYGSADYKNIHMSIHEMEKSNLITIEKIGKSSIASPNFDNPLLIDNLAQVELINKVQFLEKRKDWQILFLQINSYLREFSIIRSILIINPETNAKLNRIEFLILLRKEENKEEFKDIRSNMELLQRVHNIRIDYLMLDETSFENLMRYEDANPIKEVMSDKIAIFYPQAFWLMIKNLLDKGIRIKVEEESISLAKISEQDIVFNLARFGYKEMGTKITQGKAIGIEYLVTSILVKKDNVRRLEAIPIILAKNKEKINYSLLVFLVTKFKMIRQLYNILKVLDEITPTEEVKQIMREITGAVKQKVKTDQQVIELSLKDMEKKMRLYDVIE